MHPLKKYRIDNEMTQRQMADLLGIHQSMICHLESGKRKLSAVKAKELHKKTKGEVSKKALRPDVFA